MAQSSSDSRQGRRRAGDINVSISDGAGDEAGRNGAGDRIRTGDIDLGKVALYQLSYSRSRVIHQYRAGLMHLSNRQPLGASARTKR